MLNHPRRPRSHFAASSAPCAKTARSRTSCVSVTVSARPSKPTVCVPGIDAGTRRRHVDAAACSRRPASPSAAAARSPTARPSWRRGAPRGSTRRRRRAARTCARPLRPTVETRTCQARNSAATSTPMSARSASTRSFHLAILPAGGADDDVHAAPARIGKVRRHRGGRREVDRDVDLCRRAPRLSRRRRRGDDAGDLAAVLRRQRLDEASHPAVADQQQFHLRSCRTTVRPVRLVRQVQGTRWRWPIFSSWKEC